MNEILHANIFFFIASLATIVFCILLSLVMYQVLKITRLLRQILERVEAGSQVLAEDLANFRESLASGGLFSRLIGFIISGAGASAPKRRRTKVRDEV